MTCFEFWGHFTRIGQIPFSYFGTILSLIIFFVAWTTIIAVKEVLDNKKQKVLW